MEIYSIQLLFSCALAFNQFLIADEHDFHLVFFFLTTIYV